MIEWSKDDPNLYDFNAICVNQIPNDSLSIRGGNIRGLYWTYPNSDWKEEQRLNKINDIKFIELSAKDVIRHKLVQKIIEAYIE